MVDEELKEREEDLRTEFGESGFKNFSKGSALTQFEGIR
jgi:hypothetical protein